MISRVNFDRCARNTRKMETSFRIQRHVSFFRNLRIFKLQPEVGRRTRRGSCANIRLGIRSRHRLDVGFAKDSFSLHRSRLKSYFDIGERITSGFIRAIAEKTARKSNWIERRCRGKKRSERRVFKIQFTPSGPIHLLEVYA